ncbi:MAG: hypothetical protein HWN68_08380, partial [Desulfobacterales bacterium]|nr:hypothetical protein [Desulfobacterales bacterium]
MDWLTVVPWYVWLVIIVLILVSLVVVLVIFRGGWQWKVLHFFRDGSFELFPCTREEGKISFKPFRKGFGKKGETVEKVIVTQPSAMIHSPVGYRVYITNDDCPTTLPPPTETAEATVTCPKCKKDINVPIKNPALDIKPSLISLTTGRA